MKSEEVFLKHILEEINFLIKQTEGISFDTFMTDELLKRASARSPEIIGEAAKNISADFKKRHAGIEWKKLAGLRDKIIHGYFGVNWDIVWDVIKNKMPELKQGIQNMIRNSKACPRLRRFPIKPGVKTFPLLAKEGLGEVNGID